MANEEQMAWRMRSSKFRHVFGSPSKKEQCYECVKITKNAHDSNFCAVNPKFLAIVVESAGGGSFVVLPLDKTGRVDSNSFKVCGHAGPVLDIKWNPFNDHIIASCSDDATVKLWHIPEGGIQNNITEWLVDLHGHQRRVGYLEWHPTAAGILLSAGYDYKCILWNTDTAEPINIISVHPDTIFSISWNHDGSLFATTCKDKRIRVINPRSGEVVGECAGHQGSKTSKVVFITNKNRLFTTGFSRMSERQYGVWDVKNLSKALKMESIDSSSGVLFPYYDGDTGVVFVAGKGDGNIRYFELVNDSPYCHFLNQYQSGSPQRGLGVMPKRGVDPSKCEIMRFYKLHTVKGMVEPVGMIVPRKSEMFQEDIFPPAPSSCPSLSADEWISGQNREPILISLKDGVLSQSPTITTYKAVKRNSALLESSSVTGSKKRISPVTAPTTHTGTPAPPEKIPSSVKNIHKLSSFDHQPASAGDSDTVTVFDSQRTVSSTQETTCLTNANERLRVDKKVWSSAYTNANTKQQPTKAETNGIPRTDPEWSSSTSGSQMTPISRSSKQVLTSGTPARLSASIQSPEAHTPSPSSKRIDFTKNSPTSPVGDSYFTQPSSPYGVTPLSKSTSASEKPNLGISPTSQWQENPVYSQEITSRTNGLSPKSKSEPRPNLQHKSSVDMTPLDDVLRDVENVSQMISDEIESYSTKPVETNSYINKVAETNAHVNNSSETPSYINRASDINSYNNRLTEADSYSSRPQKVDVSSPRPPDCIIADDDEGDENDIRGAMLDCISTDAPENTLIKPSKLRASLRSRRNRSSIKDKKDGTPSRDEEIRRSASPEGLPPTRFNRRARVRHTLTNGDIGIHSYITKHVSSPQVTTPKTEINNNKVSGFVGNASASEKRKTQMKGPMKALSFKSSTSMSLQSEKSPSPQPETPSHQAQYTFSLSPTAVPTTTSAVTNDKFTFSVGNPPTTPTGSKTPMQSSYSHANTTSSQAHPPLSHTKRPSFEGPDTNKRRASAERHDYFVTDPTKADLPTTALLTKTVSMQPADLVEVVDKLRKAYFRQLEEIKSLKDQVGLKDKRIRQLEDEMRYLRVTDPSESNC